MKKFTFLILLSFLTTISIAQNATFNWNAETISDGNTLRGMTVTGDTSAVIIGYDNTFKKKSNISYEWNDINAFKAEYDFIGLSSAANTTLISSRRSKIVDNVTGGKPDVYVSGVILNSVDMGETWSVIDVGNIGTGNDPAINPNAQGSYAKEIYSDGVYNDDTLLAYVSWYDISSGVKETRSAVFRSNDAGSSWGAIIPDLGTRVITSIEIKDSIAIIGGSENLYKTNLNTDSLTDISSNLTDAGSGTSFYVSSITMQNTDTFYITTTTTGIYKTEDGGNTFSALTGTGISGSNDLYVLNDSSLVILGSSSKSVISTDKGTTWTNCAASSTIFKIGGVLNDTLYGMGKKYAYKIAVEDLLNKNINWTEVELNDTGQNLQKMFIYNNNTAIIIGYGEMCKRTTDGGLTWQPISLPKDFNEDVEINFTSISNSQSNAYSTVRNYKIADFPSESAVNDFYMDGLVIKTTDDWGNITLLVNSKIGVNDGDDVTLNPQLDGCFGLNPFTVECVDENTAYLYANWLETVTDGSPNTRGRVFKTSDGGETWTGITQDFGSAYINGIEFIADTGYIGGNKILLKTIDGGTNLTDLYPALVDANNGDDNININSLTLISGEEIYIPTTSDGVFYSTDGGNTFSKFENVAGANDFYKFDKNSFILLGTTSKSYFTNDGGETWQNPEIGATIFSIGEVFNDSLFALGKGTVYKIALEDLALKTSARRITKNSDINIQYHNDYLKLVSTDKKIDRCYVYSLSGQLISVVEGNSNVCRLNNNEFKPGLYIISASVGGKIFTDKIVFK